MALDPELLGLALTAFGVQFSVLANSAMKTVVGVPVVQAMQLRFCMQWVFTTTASLVLRCRGRPIHMLGQPGHRMLLLGRAASFALAILSLWTALRLMPVGIVTTILYLYPIFCGLLANRFLGESLDRLFWIQATLSGLGVLLVTGLGFAAPGGEGARGLALTLLAALCFATTNCLVRALKGAQTLEVQLFTDTIMAFVAMPSTLLLTGNAADWSAWSSYDVKHLVLATAAGLCALLIVIRGHQLAQASKATLFTYLEVPSAFAVQVLLFGQVPSPRELVGAALIVGAAAQRLCHEARAQSQPKVDNSALLSRGSAGECEGA